MSLLRACFFEISRVFLFGSMPSQANTASRFMAPANTKNEARQNNDLATNSKEPEEITTRETKEPSQNANSDEKGEKEDKDSKS